LNPGNLNLEVFCYIGLLRFPEQLEPSLAILPNSMKAEADELLAKLKPLSQPELLQRWGSLRDTEYVAMRSGVSQRLGVELDALPPALQTWCASWWADHNG
jgi:hypothetical protein